MSNRIKKINELIRELAAESLSANIPHEYLFTVKAVETERDLKHSVVWVSVLGDEEGFLEELQGKISEIRHFITGHMFTKYTPLVEFKIDHSEEYVQHIEELLRDK